MITVNDITRELNSKVLHSLLADNLENYTTKDISRLVKAVVNRLDGKTYDEECFGVGSMEEYYAECITEYLSDNHTIDDFIDDTEDCLYPYEFFHTTRCSVCGKPRFHAWDFKDRGRVCQYCYRKG